MVRSTPLGAALLLLGGVLAAGCSSAGDSADDGEAATAASANAALDLHVLDIWAQPIPKEELRVTVKRDGHTVSTSTGDATVFLRAAGAYAVHVEAPNHVPLDLTVTYDGSDGAKGAAVQADQAKGHGVAFGHTSRDFSGRRLTTHALYVGLRHKWFSAEGRPARRGNALKLMMDGEEAWSTVRGDLVTAKKDVMAATWWWESDFELVRSADIGASTDARWGNTILGTLENNPTPMKRVLINKFFGQSSLTGLLDAITDDAKIRYYASRPNDNFEMMQQGNDTNGKFRFDIPSFTFGARVKTVDGKAPDFELDAPIDSTVPGHDVDLTQVPYDLDVIDMASYHQKFMVVDDEVAYVGGMNLRHVDWDTSQHLVYDARREKFDASDSARVAVQNKEQKPDGGPRKDYMVRIEGPSAQDVADVFHERWEFLRGIGAQYAENATGFDVQRDIAPRDGGIQLQVTATLPKPFWEHALAETWFNAVRNAEKYIYIEDQYFRVPMLNDAIAQRMDERLDLQLVVVTVGVGPSAPECVWTARSNELFKQRYADRYSAHTLRTFDAGTREFVDIDIHSKMLVVDDVFMSVGSANKNNRGIVYEAELNVAVADPIVGDWRQRIARNMLGTDDDLSDPTTWIAALRDTAKKNDAAYQAEGHDDDPQGFIYGIYFPPSSACKYASIGPDET
jgi:phosphatidylserine/phosphatidylglycerophosphate/cardiolipin synthase-like enzyme